MVTTDEVVALLRAASVPVVLHEAASGPMADLPVPGRGEIVIVVGSRGRHQRRGAGGVRRASAPSRCGWAPRCCAPPRPGSPRRRRCCPAPAGVEPAEPGGRSRRVDRTGTSLAPSPDDESLAVHRRRSALPAGGVLVVHQQGVPARWGGHCEGVRRQRAALPRRGEAVPDDGVAAACSSHCTFASNAAASPVTVNGLSTADPSAGSATETGASTSSRPAAATGRPVGIPSRLSAGRPSRRNVHGGVRAGAPPARCRRAAAGRPRPPPPRDPPDGSPAPRSGPPTDGRRTSRAYRSRVAAGQPLR